MGLFCHLFFRLHCSICRKIDSTDGLILINLTFILNNVALGLCSVATTSPSIMVACGYKKENVILKIIFVPGGYGTDEVKLKPPRLISNTVDIS